MLFIQRLVFLFFVLSFLALESSAQFSVRQHEIIDSALAKPITRVNGFYGSTIRVLRNAPAYTDSFSVVGDTQLYRSCNFFSFVLKDNENKKLNRKIKRKTNCFVKNNIFYYRSPFEMSTQFIRAEVFGYFSLFSCNPNPTSSRFGGLNYGGHDNGMILNLGTFKSFAFTGKNLRKILASEKDLYEKYKQEKNPKSFKVMLSYLVELNRRVMLKSNYSR